MNEYDEYRYEYPLLQADWSVEVQSAKELLLSPCSVVHARRCIQEWHSRLPRTQAGPWMHAFKMSANGKTYATALWHNPSARTLPGGWIELRRMACSPDTPKYTASRFLSLMVRYFKSNHPKYIKAISYQDVSVHTGTIYRAAGWIAEYTSNARVRDRSKPRRGTARAYRSNLNGTDPDQSAKVRWAVSLTTHKGRDLTTCKDACTGAEMEI